MPAAKQVKLDDLLNEKQTLMSRKQLSELLEGFEASGAKMTGFKASGVSRAGVAAFDADFVCGTGWPKFPPIPPIPGVSIDIIVNGIPGLPLQVLAKMHYGLR